MWPFSYDQAEQDARLKMIAQEIEDLKVINSDSADLLGKMEESNDTAFELQSEIHEMVAASSSGLGKFLNSPVKALFTGTILGILLLIPFIVTLWIVLTDNEELFLKMMDLVPGF